MMMGIGGLFGLLVLVAVAYAMGLLPLDIQKSRRQTGEPALHILKTRYAQGEISKADFEEMRRALEE